MARRSTAGGSAAAALLLALLVAAPDRLPAASTPDGLPPTPPGTAEPGSDGGTADDSPPAAVSLPSLEIEEIALANGMRLLVAPRPASPLVATAWAVRFGSADEAPGETGAAHLLEHLLFQGTRTVGARRLDEELALLDREDRLWARLLEHAGSDRGGRRVERLRREIAEVRRRARDAALPGELSLLYARGGATGLDARTHEDFTLFEVAVPPERLELWFWLEWDRLREPLFRQLDREKRVIDQERLTRLAARPSAGLDRELLDRFWGAGHPYGHPPGGRPVDVFRMDRPRLRELFARHYRPERITAALVGDVDPDRVRELAARYFARLPRGAEARSPERGTPAAGAPEPRPPTGEPARRVASCPCRPRARALYPSVPFAHPDAVGLEALAGLLNGRAGRLHRSLVLDGGPAFAAWALHFGLARGGYFAVEVEGRGEATPEELLAAWDREAERLRGAPPDEAELARLRNRLAADLLREIEEPPALARRLAIHAALGVPDALRTRPRRILGVEAADLHRLARRYLDPERRTVGLLRAGEEGDAAAGWRPVEPEAER